MLRKVQVPMKKREEEVLLPSQFGLGIQEDIESDIDFVNENVEGVPVNDSVGFSESFIGKVLDDSNMVR